MPGNWPAWAPPGTRWAILTAWNPGARVSTDVANQAAQEALMAQTARWSPLPAINGRGDWREPSVLPRGLSVRDAVALGRGAGQLAVVFGIGRRAALVWLDGPDMRLERAWVRPEGKAQD